MASVVTSGVRCNLKFLSLSVGDEVTVFLEENEIKIEKRRPVEPQG
jgi:hypothetical protein